MCTTASAGKILGKAAAAALRSPPPAAAPGHHLAAKPLLSTPTALPIMRALAASAADTAGLPCHTCAATIGAARSPVPTHLVECLGGREGVV